MPVDPSTIGATVNVPTPHAPVTLSKWINERYPPLNELLSAHDVARLTRRPRWLLSGLCLIGRFPKKVKFRGRSVGWRRSEVLNWMSLDPAIDRDSETVLCTHARKHPRQACLPFKRASSCVPMSKCAVRRSQPKCKNRTPPASSMARESAQPVHGGGDEQVARTRARHTRHTEL